MWKNFIAVILRSIITNKILKRINMAGLVIGLACFVPWNWMQDFPYYLDFRSLFSVFAALLVVITALTAITLTAMHVARADPALCLLNKYHERNTN